jgi:hypothetical protein
MSAGVVFYQLHKRELLRDKALCPCQNTKSCTGSPANLDKSTPYFLYVVSSGRHHGHSYAEMLRSFKPIHLQISVDKSDSLPAWKFISVVFGALFVVLVYGEYTQRQVKPYMEYAKIAEEKKKAAKSGDAFDDADELDFKADHSEDHFDDDATSSMYGT